MIAMRPALRQWLYVILVGLTLPACGVKLHDRPPSSELLRSLTVRQGVAGDGTVRLELRYRQPYPVAITMVCTLTTRDGNAAAPPTRATIPPRHLDAPATVAVDGVVEIIFPVPPPGVYTARCVTDKAQDAISATVSIPG